MTKTISKYQESFKIRANEVDVDGNITLQAICSLFQEVAGNHALELEFDITNLNEKDLTWVLHRLDIEIIDSPKWRDEITIQTWPAASDALRAYRDYLIMDGDGMILGKGLSYWMMINIQNRRPVRMPAEILEMRADSDTSEHVIPIKNDRIKPFDEPDSVLSINVRKSDLDMNEHVNNARYVEWMMEHYTQGNSLRSPNIDIMFIKESLFGDEIKAEIKKMSQGDLHQLKNQEGRLLALAMITLK